MTTNTALLDSLNSEVAGGVLPFTYADAMIISGLIAGVVVCILGILLILFGEKET